MFCVLWVHDYVYVWHVYMCSSDPKSAYLLRKESLEQRGGGGGVRGLEDMCTLYNDLQFMLRGFYTQKNSKSVILKCDFKE